MPVHIVDHPLVHDALATLREKSTPPELFRRMAVRISLLLAAEATRDIPSTTAAVETPLGPAPGRRVKAGVVVVPVLRAGLGMLDAVLELIPSARVGLHAKHLHQFLLTHAEDHPVLPVGHQAAPRSAASSIMATIALRVMRTRIG